MNQNTTPEDIVKRVLKGETDSFGKIVDTYQNIIFSIGMRFFKNEQDSYDFAQEVFIKAYNNLTSYGGFGQFKYWLIKMAYNYAKDKIKTKRNQTIDLKIELADTENEPSQQHLSEEIRQLLLKEIHSLPEKYRICLDFYFFIGLTYKQIEDITNIPINTIKSHVLRAKNILRDRLRGTIAEDYNEM